MDQQKSVSNDFATNLLSNPGLLFMSVIALLLLILILYRSLGELLYRVCGVDILPFMSKENRENGSQQASDVISRNQLQDQGQGQDDLVAYKSSETLKQERREKYLKFLSPYTKVIQESDVYYGIEKPSKGSQRFMPLDRLSFRSNTEYSSKDDHDSIGEMANNTRRTSDCCTIDSRHQCWIKVRSPSLFKGAQYVEGYCSICLLEIEVGDMMVQSTRKVCHHVFHHECALVWLSTGKKRCPVCRNFFVPGSRVDDQDVIQHKEDDLEAVSFDRRSQYCLQNDEILDDPLHVSRKSSLSMSSRGINQDLEQSSCDVNKAAIEHTGEIQITKERSLRGKGLSQIHPL